MTIDLYPEVPSVFCGPRKKADTKGTNKIDKEQVTKLIEEYLSKYAESDLSKEQVTKLIESYLTDYTKKNIDVKQVVTIVEKAISDYAAGDLTKEQVTKLIEEYITKNNETVNNYLTDYSTKIEKYLDAYTKSIEQYVQDNKGTGTDNSAEIAELKKELESLKKQVKTDYEELAKNEQETGKIWLDNGAVWSRLVLNIVVSFDDTRWTPVCIIPNFDKIQTIITIKGIISSFGIVQNAIHNADLWKVDANGQLYVRAAYGSSTVSAIYMEYTKRA